MKISDIILIILALISLAMVGGYFFGNSPAFEQTLLVLIITFLFKIQTSTNLNNLETKNLKERFHKLEKSFIHLVKDFKGYMK